MKWNENLINDGVELNTDTVIQQIILKKNFGCFELN